VLDPVLVGDYRGGCADGLADGVGVALGAGGEGGRGGSRYEGEFRAGKKHGRGVIVWSNGDRYEGGFANDMREGLGLYRWGGASHWSGDVYLGNYHQDKRHGRGRYAWANGDQYDGEWKEDNRNGYSAMEIQRLRMSGAWKGYLAEPQPVICASRAVGLAAHAGFSGVAERFEGDHLLVRVERIDPQHADQTSGLPVPGDRVLVRPAEAYPCAM